MDCCRCYYRSLWRSSDRFVGCVSRHYCFHRSNQRLGILSACELLEQLSLHRVIPKVFLQLLPKTGSPYISVLSFVAFSGMLYATASASLTVISEMFSLVWLTVMSLFPISLLLLKFNRGRLPRTSRTPLLIVVASLLVALVILAGNIAFNPKTTGCVYFCFHSC